jgi:hypothetical protein
LPTYQPVTPPNPNILPLRNGPRSSSSLPTFVPVRPILSNNTVSDGSGDSSLPPNLPGSNNGGVYPPGFNANGTPFGPWIPGTGFTPLIKPGTGVFKGPGIVTNSEIDTKAIKDPIPTPSVGRTFVNNWGTQPYVTMFDIPTAPGKYYTVWGSPYLGVMFPKPVDLVLNYYTVQSTTYYLTWDL